MSDKKKTVLVVDDVPDDIVILEEILKRDYQVKAVTNGEAALRIARADPPDLILLDIMMPDMDGFEVCRRLKEDSEGAMTPVIFLTAKTMVADESMGFSVGGVDYIKKPVDPELVRMRIKAHLDQKDRALRSSEVRFRRLFETSKDGIVIVDKETGMIVDVNPSMAAMMGLSLEAFLGKGVSDLEFLSNILSQDNRLSETQRRDYVRNKDWPLETADGRRIFIEFFCNPYRVDNREVTQVNIREITDLVIAERERDKVTARLAHYLSTSPTVTYSLALKDKSVVWQWISENIQGLLGYTPAEALAPDWWFRNINAIDRGAALGAITELVQRGSCVREYRFARKDRSLVWLRDEMRLVQMGGAEEEIVGTLTDISAQKLAEEEIHLKSAALEVAANAVVITDREGTVKWANRAFESLTGYTRGEAVGKNPRELMRSGCHDVDVYRVLWETILSGNVWNGELVNRRKSGELYDEEMTIAPVLDGAGFISNFVAIKNDITERKRSHDRLEAALEEKQELLKEIHHRVNNNMQVIMSLLNIYSNNSDNEDFREKMEDIARRLHSMAIVHRQFHESEDLSRIDFARYLQELLESLQADFPLTSRSAVFRRETDHAFLGLEQAVPAGLIVSELLTNAMKFAFSKGQGDGTIGMALRMAAGGILEVEIRDDGIGLPAGLDPGRAQSLGMMLMRMLSGQLNGSVDFLDGPGTTAILRFPVRDKSQLAPGGARREAIRNG